MKKHFQFVILFIFIFTLIGCKSKKEIKLSLDEYDATLYVGESYEIKVNAKNVENPKYEYIVDENSGITFNENVFTVSKMGTFTIHIGLVDNKEVSKLALNITVKNYSINDLSVINNLSLLVGESYEITYEISPINGVGKISFLSNDDNIVTVNENGEINAISAGNAVIQVIAKSDENEVYKSIDVEVRGKDKPEFKFTDDYVENIKVNWNDETSLLSDISAIDIEDGDISQNIIIENKEVIKEYGTQILKYRVSDSDDNENTYERKIEVVWNYDVKFIGHAGSYYGIMNSEEAILYAITNLKYQAVEVDIKQTKDGVFVLSHDNTFGDYSIASTNWDVLKEVEITQTRKASSSYPVHYGDLTGSGQYTTKICSLERFLQICKEHNVTAVVELKSSNGISNTDQSRMQALMDVIEANDMLTNVIFLGSQYNCLIWTRNNGYNYIPCQYLVNSCESEEYLQRCITYDLDISINVTSNYSNSDEWLARYKDAGLKISTYTYTQYVDYNVVQTWIDKGVDFVTCDWQKMEKLVLPKSNIEQVKYNVKFLDFDGTVLKETQVVKGKYAPAPIIKAKEGYTFIGWDKELSNIQSDTVFTAQYEINSYSIIYNENISKISESEWTSKEEFVNDLYSDLFAWIKSKGTLIDGLTIDGDTYTLTRNGTKATFASVEDLISIDIYVFEKTISNIMYKPVTRNSDGTCSILIDNNYFLNSDEYMIKYQGVDQWLYNCIIQSYPKYNTTYTPTSAGKIQIFFRMHQWAKGTKISAFDTLPKKYTKIDDTSIQPVLPTLTSYTILDSFDLPKATGNKEFLGWYLTSNCDGDEVTKIEAGSTGTLVLYAKWGE